MSGYSPAIRDHGDSEGITFSIPLGSLPRGTCYVSASIRDGKVVATFINGERQ